MTATALRAQLAARIAKASDETNLVALLTLETAGALTAEEKLVRGVITEHLYDKHPQVQAAYDAWAESLDDEREPVQVICDALNLDLAAAIVA
jgi:hypothetical protein